MTLDATLSLMPGDLRALADGATWDRPVALVCGAHGRGRPWGTRYRYGHAVPGVFGEGPAMVLAFGRPVPAVVPAVADEDATVVVWEGIHRPDGRPCERAIAGLDVEQPYWPRLTNVPNALEDSIIFVGDGPHVPYDKHGLELVCPDPRCSARPRVSFRQLWERSTAVARVGGRGLKVPRGSWPPDHEVDRYVDRDRGRLRRTGRDDPGRRTPSELR